MFTTTQLARMHDFYSLPKNPVAFVTGVCPPLVSDNIAGYIGAPGLSKPQKQMIDSGVKAANLSTVMKTLHLATAVLLSIEQFHTKAANFSAYDITRTVREEVQAGRFDLKDVTARDYFAGQYLPVVTHDSVRELVSELFENKLIPDYEGRPYHGGGNSYVLYTNTKAAPVTMAAAASAPVQTPIPFVATAPTPVAQVAVKSVLKTPDSDMWEKAKRYIRNQVHSNNSHHPSIKAIQSRLKGYSVTCAQIRAYFDSQPIFLVYPNKNKLTSDATISPL